MATSGELPANRLHAILAQKLEDLILQGTYAPGDMLPPARELARQYGVSVAVVRDATRTLAGKGLITVQQGVGTSVSKDLDSGLVQSFTWALRHSQVTRREVAELASIIETQSALLATVRRTDADVAQLDTALSQCDCASGGASWEQISACHNRFHSALIRAAHNRALLAAFEPLTEVVFANTELEQSTDAVWHTCEQHRRILDCVRSGDVALTRAALEAHYPLS